MTTDMSAISIICDFSHTHQEKIETGMSQEGVPKNC